MRFALITIIASLFASSLAFAKVDPDATYSGDPPLAFNSSTLCLGADCPIAISGATQPADCNFAGLGIPEPFMPIAGEAGMPSIRITGGDAAGSAFMLTPPIGGDSFDLGAPVWPSNWDTGYDANPIRGIFDSDGVGLLPNGIFGENPATTFGATSSRYSSLNVTASASQLGPEIGAHIFSDVTINNTNYVTLLFDANELASIRRSIDAAGIAGVEDNVCRVVLLPSDPNLLRTGRHGGGSWGQQQDDQWAIKRVGYTTDENSAWNLLPARLEPVIVAVIDTGLDWQHLDIAPESLWKNPNEIAGNGIDDDRNGYVDDIIGWDFLARSNAPWDYDGHGTVVAGVIAAAHNNAGMAGISPNARIMVLKAVNNFGSGRASFLAEAIVYAVDNGAKLINISVGGSGTSSMESSAIDYAHSKGVLIVAAAGNEGVELTDFGPGGHSNVLTVGATHMDDRAAAFSNYGDAVDIVAPGVDVLSLRARYTDVNFRPQIDDSYELGANNVGDDMRYTHVSGTSFSAPIVTGTAALLLGKNPSLAAEQVKYLLLATADDIEQPGRDKYAGYGLLNARSVLTTTTDFFLTAEITGTEVTEKMLNVKGTINADHFKRAWMQIGAGETPGQWRYVGAKRKYPIQNGVLGSIPLQEFEGSELWQIVVSVEHKNGLIKRVRYPIRMKN